MQLEFISFFFFNQFSKIIFVYLSSPVLDRHCFSLVTMNTGDSSCGAELLIAVASLGADHGL